MSNEKTLFNTFKIIVVIFVIALVGLYVSGYYFLMTIDRPPFEASPLTHIRYWYHYGDQPEIRQPLFLSLLGGLGLTLGLGSIPFIPQRKPLHGNARFATTSEIKKAGLLGADGIILGSLGGQYLMLSGQQGILLEAPPRSGKGVGVAITNLLNWPGSVLTSDLKGENFKITGGFRAKHGQEVHLFDPLSKTERTSQWNPFFYVSDVPYKRIDDLQRIATMLYPQAPGVDPFWASSTRSLFLGIALYIYETEGLPRTIGEVLRQGMASDSEGFQKHWRRVLDTCEEAGYPLSSVASQTLSDVIDLAPVTASSIRKSFTSHLELWLNPFIDAATSGNDFDLRDLRKRPISIYVRINPDDIKRLEPLTNLFFQQAVGLQTQELPEENPELKIQLLCLFDEFTALGRIPVIAESAAFLPGYNVRNLIIVQSFSQLIEKYGVEGAKSLRKMLAARIVFPPNDLDDAEAISRELGTYTVKQKSFSKKAWGGHTANVNISEQPRRLLLANEVKELGNDKMLLFYEGLRPVQANRIRYYEDKNFSARVMPPPIVPKLIINTISSRPAGNALVNDRPIDSTDINYLMKLELEDFNLNFDNIDVPNRSMTDEEVDKAVDDFLSNVVTD